MKLSESIEDRPLAATGLTSYRYRGRYGWIMIGAYDKADALNEASRSTTEKIEECKLQQWIPEECIYR